jgi:hypothetical protein
MALLPARQLIGIVAVGVALLVLLTGLRHHINYSKPVSGLGDLRAIPPRTSPAANTDVVLYVHYDGDPIGRRNIEFFIKHGLHSKADFYFIINGFDLTVEIPEASNIHVIKRENTCYDLGTLGVVLQQDDGALMKKYKRFIMLNSSVRGPFFPNWARLSGTACWSNYMLAPLSTRTKLVGLTANCDHEFPYHLQSFGLATDLVGLHALLPALQCFGDRTEAINQGELAMTQRVRDAGYDAVPLYSAYADGGRSGTSNQEFWNGCTHKDIFYPEAYFRADLHPFDTLFVKIHRQDGMLVNTDSFSPLGMTVLQQLTQWADDSQFSSYEQC